MNALKTKKQTVLHQKKITKKQYWVEMKKT